jgi:hypothetical protein
LCILEASDKHRISINRLLVFLEAESKLKRAVLAAAPDLVEVC